MIDLIITGTTYLMEDLSTRLIELLTFKQTNITFSRRLLYYNRRLMMLIRPLLYFILITTVGFQYMMKEGLYLYSTSQMLIVIWKLQLIYQLMHLIHCLCIVK